MQLMAFCLINLVWNLLSPLDHFSKSSLCSSSVQPCKASSYSALFHTPCVARPTPPPFSPQPLSPSSVTFNDCESLPFCRCHRAAVTRSCTPFCSFLLILPHRCHFPPFFSSNFSPFPEPRVQRSLTIRRRRRRRSLIFRN